MFAAFPQLGALVNTVVRYASQGNARGGLFGASVICSLLQQVKDLFLSSISDVLPVALSVAGAILVVNLGWRLFRNFTKG